LPAGAAIAGRLRAVGEQAKAEQQRRSARERRGQRPGGGVPTGPRFDRITHQR
jgi:hypothetical protein